MSDTFRILFPGLGIDEFTMNRIAFRIGSIEVRWYGILITCGIALAFLYAYYRGKKNENVIFDDIIDIGLWTVLLGVLGARLYYVLTTLNEFEYNSLIDVIAIWNGGLAIYGGIIGGCIGIVIACKIKKIKWLKAFDMIGPGVMLAQAVGRWGNFCNGEAYGYAIGETTRFYFFNTEHLLPSGEGTLFHTLRMGLYPTSWASEPVYYHPTFFYECVWNLIGFALINVFYKRKKFDGQVALWYFVWYGFGRMFIEGFRTDSLYLPGTTLRISQCLGFVCFLGGLLLLIAVPLWRKYRPAHAIAAEPTASEASIAEMSEEAIEETTEESTAPTAETEDQDNGKID